MSELQGKECYFFKHDYNTDKYSPIGDEEECWLWTAFVVPNPNDYNSKKKWHSMTMDEKTADNKKWEAIYINNSPNNRSDPALIQAVEELGDAANGDYAELKIVEIPDGVEYTIEEYDGLEHVAEKHRTWC